MQSEKLFKAIISEGDVVYDVGANIGSFAYRFSKLAGERGSVYCFEPMQEAYKMLANKVKDLKLANVKTYEVAISDKKGEVTLYHSDNDFAFQASTIKKELGNRGRLGEGIKKKNVKALTLDDFCGNKYPDFINIDVEGAEDLVFKGMKNILCNSLPTIFFEFGTAGRNTKFPFYFKELKEYGYKFYITEITRFIDSDGKPNIKTSNNKALGKKYISI